MSINLMAGLILLYFIVAIAVMVRIEYMEEDDYYDLIIVYVSDEIDL